MFRVDARAGVKMPDLQQGRALAFVNCLECGYYMLFKPEFVAILSDIISVISIRRMHQTLSLVAYQGF